MEKNELKNRLKQKFDEEQINHYKMDTYIDAANKGIEKLRNMITFIEKSNEDPSILLTSLKDEMGDNKHFYFLAMKGYEENGNKLIPQDFQKYLLERLNVGFQQITENEKLGKGYRFILSSPNTFPTKFILYFEDTILCRMDIINKLYGEVDLINEEFLLKTIEENNKMIKKQEKELAFLFESKKSPIKRVKTIGDIFIILFKRKKINEQLNTKIQSINSYIKEVKDNNLELERVVKTIPSTNSKIKQKYESVEALLIKYGYSYTDDRSLLY